MTRELLIMTILGCLLFPALTANAQYRTQEQLRIFYLKREKQAPEPLKKKLAQLRAEIARRHLHFTISYTGVADRHPLTLIGARPLNMAGFLQLKKRFQHRHFTREEKSFFNDKPLLTAPLPTVYDSRQYQPFTDVKQQLREECWAYATIGALECSAIRVNHLNTANDLDLSAMQLISCSGAGDLRNGGWPYLAFDYLLKQNIRMMTEVQYPVNSAPASCPAIVPASNVKVINWGLVDITVDTFKIASVQSIKSAVFAYGAVNASMKASPAFKYYTGGVFDEQPTDYIHPDNIDHAIVIIGWDDSKQAWLIRNSYGVNWGMDGYGWVNYKANNIGYCAVWCFAAPFTTMSATVRYKVKKK